MGFPTFDRLTARWIPEEGDGFDHATISRVDGGIAISGVVIGERNDRKFGARYTIDLNADWVTRRVMVTATDGSGVHLRSDGAGRWEDENGPVAALDGCIDVDLSASPVTNTLPMRRLDWRFGEPVSLAMVYIPFDPFRPERDDQIYTRQDERRFRYQAADGSFESVIEIDTDGLVSRYPQLFFRQKAT